MDKVELLTAICSACGTAVGHDMACPCANSIKLNQDEPRYARKSNDPELIWAEEVIGYTH